MKEPLSDRADLAALRLAAIVDCSDDAIISKDLDGIIQTWNRGAERIFGYPAAEAVGQSITILIPAERAHEEPEILARLRRGERVDHYETIRVRKDGQRIDISVTISPIRDATGRIIAASKIARDITERKRIERHLQQALADKDVLLQEVNHRVKNNLQMLGDLLYLQALEAPTPEAQAALQEACSRLFAIARLHEELYPALGGGGVPLADYLDRVRTSFAKVHPSVTVGVDVSGTAVKLDLDRTIGIGLIVNELLTNAVKHGQATAMRLRLCSDGDQVSLQVENNGAGPAPEVERTSASSLGLRLVQAFARRLQATLKTEKANGPCTTLTFPLHAEAARERQQGSPE